MEELIPISVKTIKIHGIDRLNVRYYNIVVKECPHYEAALDTSFTFVRSATITRLKHNDQYLHDQGLSWPPHPVNHNGEHIGAIIILQSKDNRILLLRNGHLWGLPKGVRNYTNFTKLKSRLNLDAPEIELLILDNIETPEENICRETAEETGIHLDPANLIHWPEDNYAYTRFTYNVDFNAEDYADILTNNGTDHENDEIRWFNISDLHELIVKHKMYRSNKVFNHVTFLFLSQYLKNT